MAYILGFFAADGYITITKRGGYYWCIQITDKELLEKIKVTIKSDHKISERFNGINKRNIYRLQVGSVEMCKDLRRLGFLERKTKNILIPEVPQDLFRDFVRGYFDGDGNVWTGLVHKKRKNKLLVIRTVFTSCSRDFLERLKYNLENVDIKRGVLGKGKGNYYRLTYSIRGSLKLYDFMYNHMVIENLFLERKKAVFDNYIEMRL